MITLFRPYHPLHNFIQDEEVSFTDDGIHIVRTLPSTGGGIYYWIERLKCWGLSSDPHWKEEDKANA